MVEKIQFVSAASFLYNMIMLFAKTGNILMPSGLQTPYAAGMKALASPAKNPPPPWPTEFVGGALCRAERSHACGLCPMQGGTLRESPPPPTGRRGPTGGAVRGHAALARPG